MKLNCINYLCIAVYGSFILSGFWWQKIKVYCYTCSVVVIETVVMVTVVIVSYKSFNICHTVYIESCIWFLAFSKHFGWSFTLPWESVTLTFTVIFQRSTDCQTQTRIGISLQCSCYDTLHLTEICYNILACVHYGLRFWYLHDLFVSATFSVLSLHNRFCTKQFWT